MYNNSIFYGSVQGVGRAEVDGIDSQLDEITNDGQIAGNAVMLDDDYQALTTEEKENGKMYFTYEE